MGRYQLYIHQAHRRVFFSSNAGGQLWSSKSSEFHPRLTCSMHFQLELVTNPLLEEPSIPGGGKPKFVAATPITLVLPGMMKSVAVLHLPLSFPKLIPSANSSMESRQVNVAVKSGIQKMKSATTVFIPKARKQELGKSSKSLINHNCIVPPSYCCDSKVIKTKRGLIGQFRMFSVGVEGSCNRGSCKECH